MSQEDRTCRHPKLTDDGNPQAPPLAAPALTESVSRTESGQELLWHWSPKREVTNQTTDFVLARQTRWGYMKPSITKAPSPTARHPNNRP